MPKRFPGELTFSQINFILICKNVQKLEIRNIIRNEYQRSLSTRKKETLAKSYSKLRIEENLGQREEE